jgi:hypothetical protein
MKYSSPGQSQRALASLTAALGTLSTNHRPSTRLANLPDLERGRKHPQDTSAYFGLGQGPHDFVAICSADFFCHCQPRVALRLAKARLHLPGADMSCPFRALLSQSYH